MANPILSSLAGRFYRTLEPLGHRPLTRVRQPFLPPVAGRMAGMLREGKHDSLRFTLSKLHRDSRRSSIEAMLRVLDDAESADRWIERLWRWYRENREFHATSVLIHGLIKYAWLKRGGAADDVAGQPAAAFPEALDDAERLLDKALAVQPDNTDLLCLRLLTARGLGLESNLHWERFRALIGIDPGHYRGHLAMLENLKTRWGGSDAAMFQFARGRAGQMPDGHPLKALVVYAHFAMRHQRGRAADSGADDYFLSPETGSEVEAAWAESVNSAQFRDESCSEELHNLFAAALYLAGRDQPARAALALMDGHCLAAPWHTMAMDAKEAGNPGWVVDRVAAALNRA